MPPFARLFLGILMCLAIFACVVVPLALSFWQIYCAPAQNMPARPALKELWGTVLGILAVDPLLYVLYRPALPKLYFYGGLVVLNGLCLIFVCYGFVAWWLYQKAMQNLPAPVPESEATAAMQTSSV